MFSSPYSPTTGYLRVIEPSSSNNGFGNSNNGFSGTSSNNGFGGFGTSSNNGFGGFGTSSNNGFGTSSNNGFGISQSNGGGFGISQSNEFGSNSTTIPEITPRDEVIRKLNEHKKLIVKQKLAKYIYSFNDRTNVDRHEITKVNTEFIEDIVDELNKLLASHNYKVTYNDKMIIFEYVYL